MMAAATRRPHSGPDHRGAGARLYPPRRIGPGQLPLQPAAEALTSSRHFPAVPGSSTLTLTCACKFARASLTVHRRAG
jgi:hypothetical protein